MKVVESSLDTATGRLSHLGGRGTRSSYLGRYVKKLVVGVALSLGTGTTICAQGLEPIRPDQFDKTFQNTVTAAAQCRKDIRALSREGYDPVVNSSADQSCPTFLVGFHLLMHSPDVKAFAFWADKSGRNVEEFRARLSDWTDLNNQLASFGGVYDMSLLPKLQSITVYLATQTSGS